jgi:hypothetical protein
MTTRIAPAADINVTPLIDVMLVLLVEIDASGCALAGEPAGTPDRSGGSGRCDEG